MAESLLITLLPVLFLLVLYAGELLLRRKGVDMGGEPPIGRTLFLLSKCAMVLPWGAAVAQSWGVDLSLTARPGWVKAASFVLWGLGFGLLFLGRFTLGNSFRVGSAKDKDKIVLKVRGVFRLSRNPMYLGAYLTFLAAALYTLNPVVLAVGIFITVVHHKIVLAEEERLGKEHGEEYFRYCRRVRRYL